MGQEGDFIFSAYIDYNYQSRTKKLYILLSINKYNFEMRYEYTYMAIYK